MKQIKLILSISLFTLILLSCAQQSTKPIKQPNNLSVTFKVTSISKSTYKATPIKPNKDKPMVIFTQSDIKGNQPISNGQLVKAYYKPLKGEDQFLYVKPLETKSLTEYYTITKVIDHTNGNDEYYGTSNKSNIYFTSDYIQSIGQLKSGDKVKAVFENNQDDSLLYVSKLN